MAKKPVTPVFDWKKTAWKVGRSALIIFLSGVFVVYQDNPTWLALVPVVEGTLNWLKHRPK